MSFSISAMGTSVPATPRSSAMRTCGMGNISLVIQQLPQLREDKDEVTNAN